MENTVDNLKRGKKKVKRKLIIGAVISALILILLIIGLSRAWFVSQANIETLITVVPPDQLSIRGEHGEALTSLDLSYNKDEATDNGDGTKTVNITRVISVCSNQPNHRLEIVHTTNLKGLKFSVYSATEESKEGKYIYTNKTLLKGKYINGTGAADKSYGLANKDKHAQNFTTDAETGETYGNVQAHAEPLYWKVINPSPQEGKDEDVFAGKQNTDTGAINRGYVNYYVLEISWTEDTKESDLFYVLAKEA